MKTFILACFLIASASAAFIPAQQQRHRRDVSELTQQQPAYSYLPPGEKLSIPEVAVEAAEITTPVAAELTATEAPSAVLGNEGYEYRTVRRLKYRYRTRRDVSHLGQHYLPPSSDYLPPSDSLENETDVADTEEVLPAGAAAPRVANEYLPPVAVVEEKEAEEEAAPNSTEASVAASDDDDTVAQLAAVREADTETEPEAAAADSAPAAETVADEEVPQDSAVLAADGYHYKQPVEEALLKSAAPGEYLPPLNEEVVVEAVGPEESAVLADDGYHYRAIRRLRF